MTNACYAFILEGQHLGDLLDWLEPMQNSTFDVRTVYDSNEIAVLDDRWVFGNERATRILVQTHRMEDAIYFKLRWSDHYIYETVYDDTPAGILFA